MLQGSADGSGAGTGRVTPLQLPSPQAAAAQSHQQDAQGLQRCTPIVGDGEMVELPPAAVHHTMLNIPTGERSTAPTRPLSRCDKYESSIQVVVTQQAQFSALNLDDGDAPSARKQPVNHLVRNTRRDDPSSLHSHFAADSSSSNGASNGESVVTESLWPITVKKKTGKFPRHPR